MKIGIDMDGVTVNTFEGFLEFYNKKFNSNFKIEDFTEYNLWPTLGISREKAMELMEEYFLSESFSLMKPSDGMKNTIEKLSDNEFFIVTSRPKKFEKLTSVFLKKHFGKVNFIIFHTDDFHTENGGQSKAEVCSKEILDFFIEDCAEYANDCAKKGTKVFLINKPWNAKKKIANGVIRVNGWNEILEKIENEN